MYSPPAKTSEPAGRLGFKVSQRFSVHFCHVAPALVPTDVVRFRRPGTGEHNPRSAVPALSFGGYRSSSFVRLLWPVRLNDLRDLFSWYNRYVLSRNQIMVDQGNNRRTNSRTPQVA